MKKNSQIHLYLETELLEKLKKLAEVNNISVSEVCRRKLKDIPQLNRIESLILEIKEKVV
ncbi:hypothetical protein AUJ63_02345 [Candidatus Pacearchaeota archaeon CG1_02_35_32]|nr:MAG: hypothetical protein AUJ63_02345 [Candidatus Pacearchaeota archaeon CG1_02_35_32]